MVRRDDSKSMIHFFSVPFVVTSIHIQCDATHEICVQNLPYDFGIHLIVSIASTVNGNVIEQVK